MRGGCSGQADSPTASQECKQAGYFSPQFSQWCSSRPSGTATVEIALAQESRHSPLDLQSLPRSLQGGQHQLGGPVAAF